MIGEVFIRNPDFGGLSMKLVFSTRKNVVANLEDMMAQDASVTATWEKAGINDSEAERMLDSVFQDHAWRNGPDRLWRVVMDGRYGDELNLPAVSGSFRVSPVAANALLIEMSERWAAADEASRQDAVTRDDVSALHGASLLIGKGKEPQLMAYLGSLYKVNPKQAAMAFNFAQHLMLDFYRENTIL
jgi:hypothetical protein